MPQYELGYRDYWRIISKRRWVIILTFLSVTLGTIVYLNLQTPVYKAFATVKIEQRKTLVGALMEYIAWSPRQPMVTQAMIIESRIIAEVVAKRLGLVKEGATVEEFNRSVSEIQNSISTEEVKDTNLIQIIVFSDDPRKAALIANEAARVYVEYDLEQKMKQVRQVRKFIEEQLTTVQERLESSENALKKLKEEGRATGLAVPLENKLAELRANLSELLVKATEKHPRVERLKEQIQNLEGQLKALPDDELEFGRLSRDIKVNEGLYTTLRGKFEEAQIAEAEKIGDATIVDKATEPKAPIKPQKKTGALLGGVMGFVLGLILSFVVEGLDTSIGTIEDVENLLKLPVLGVIPYVKIEQNKARGKGFKKRISRSKLTKLDEIKVRLIVHDQPHSSIAESYRTVRTSLKLSEGQKRAILITSSGPKEGKTTILVNLALTTAQMGNRTLLVSTDLRRPAIYQTFGLKREPGLIEVLSQTISWEKALRRLPDFVIGEMGFDEAMRTPGLDNLSILTCGHLPLNPAELLSTKEMANLIAELKAKFDVVFFDSPPVLPITDATLLASKVDGVVIIYEIGRTARGALLRTKTQLEAAGAKIFGIVLNYIRPETEMYPSYYSQYYHRYYGKEKKKPKGLFSQNDTEE